VRAAAVMKANTGATGRTLHALQDLLAPPPGVAVSEVGR